FMSVLPVSGTPAEMRLTVTFASGTSPATFRICPPTTPSGFAGTPPSSRPVVSAPPLFELPPPPHELTDAPKARTQAHVALRMGPGSHADRGGLKNNAKRLLHARGGGGDAWRSVSRVSSLTDRPRGGGDGGVARARRELVLHAAAEIEAVDDQV